MFCYGTGGLVRAYSEALSGAIDNANIIEKDLGYLVSLKVSYSDNEKAKYFFSGQNIKIIDTKFDENVEFTAQIPKEKYVEILNQKEEFKFKILDIKITKERYIQISN